MTEFVDVVIVGAGISGISAAWHLQDRCPDKSYVILERRENLGGTWDLFKYPGIRSDSDMFTLGFRFKPWTSEKAIADGPSIMAYLKETVAEYGIDKHIRYGQKVVGADWSDADNRWTLRVDRDGEEVEIKASFLFACSGYYNYDQGYSPEFAGAEDFEGTIIHPQHWPEDLDYEGKKIVVIGSGATAVTLIPALANSGAGHVTMLQRSPTYIGSLPDVDPFTVRMNKTLPAEARLRRQPVEEHPVPVGAVPDRPAVPEVHAQDADDHGRAAAARGLRRREALRPALQPVGPATVPGAQRRSVQDHPRRARPTSSPTRSSASPKTGIKLASGEELQADIIVTATGLNLQLFGGAAISRNGVPVELNDTMAYKGMMLTHMPNMAFTIGYTNASWTLKADLVSEFVCRVLNYMDANGFDTVEPQHPGNSVDERPLMDFTPGYVLRALDYLPKAGHVAPWRLKQNYLLDLRLIRRGKVDDEALQFTKHRAPVTASA